MYTADPATPDGDAFGSSARSSGGPVFGSAPQALALAGAAMDFVSTAVTGLDGSACGELLIALGAVQAKLSAVHAAVLRRFDAADAHDADGYGSTSAWLTAKAQLTRKDARAAVREMRRLGERPRLDAALGAGDITRSWALAIADWTRKLPAQMRDETDRILLQAASAGASLDDLATIAACAIETWRAQQPDSDDPDPGDRFLQLGTTFGGAGHLRGDLTPECTATVRAVLDALGKKAGPEDDRTEGQGFHDALQLACAPQPRVYCSDRAVSTLPSSRRRSSDRTLAARPGPADTAPMTVADGIARQIQDSGYAVIPGLVSQQAVAAARAELGALLNDARWGSGFDGTRTKRVWAPLAVTRCMDQAVLAPLVLEAVEQAIGPGAQFGNTCAIQVHPGQQAQVLHYEQGIYPLPRDRDVMITALWALDDFTAANGATRVVPGSHLRPAGKPDAAEAVPAEMPAGSVLLFSGRLYHGAGANATDRPRLGVVIDYIQPWLRPCEAHTLSASHAEARQLPQRLQELLGFNQPTPYLGFVNGRHPREWLMNDQPNEATRSLADRD